MLPTPKKFALVVGKGEGKSKLTAFDAALLDAGIGNTNLLRVSSVLPPRCELREKPELSFGMLLPVAYGTISSNQKGQRISAAIGVGIPEDPDCFGMIMEFSGTCSAEEAASAVEAMVREAFEMRGIRLREVLVKSIEHVVEECGAVIAACPLFY